MVESVKESSLRQNIDLVLSVGELDDHITQNPHVVTVQTPSDKKIDTLLDNHFRITEPASVGPSNRKKRVLSGSAAKP